MTSDISYGLATAPLMPALIVVGSLFLLYAVYLRALPKPFPGIPYNIESANRLSGDIPHFEALQKAGQRASKFWPQLAKRHNSPLTQFFTKPFSRPSLVIADFHEARDLIAKRSKVVGRAATSLDAWTGAFPGHFISMLDSNPAFKPARALSKDLMTPNFLNDVSAPASYNKVSSFVELWKLKAHIAKGSPFDAFDDLEFLTYDIMMAAAFGIHDNDSETVRHLKHLQAADLSGTSVPSVNQVFPFPSFPNPPLLQALHITTKAVATSFHKPWPRLFHLFNNMRPAMRQQYKTKETIIQSYIDESTRRFMEKGQDFTPFSAVDRMVHREAVTAQKEGRRPVFDSLLFNDSLFGYLIGGQDSTHSTLSFMVKHLAANQAAQSKLRSALYLSHRTVRGEGRRPTIQEINKAQIPYLDAFIEETLRSSAPASAIEKQTLEDITLLGHVIPKGTSIVCLLSGPTLSEAGFQVPAHLRSESSKAQVTDRLDDWAASEYAPAEFRPERWLYTDDSGEVAFSNTAGPFLAFSAGPRGCWGKRLAYLELRLMVTLLVWELDFGQLPPELENWEEEEGLFSKPKSCLVRIKSTAAAKG